jgi:hypothetical protein
MSRLSIVPRADDGREVLEKILHRLDSMLFRAEICEKAAQVTAEFARADTIPADTAELTLIRATDLRNLIIETHGLTARALAEKF